MKVLYASMHAAICFICVPAVAGDCSDYQSDKARAFAEETAEQVVGKYGGGNNVRSDVYECYYNSYTKEFEIEMGVEWDGSMTGTDYRVRGILDVNRDGSSPEFTQSYTSESVENLELLAKVVGSAIVLQRLSEQAADDPGSDADGDT